MITRPMRRSERGVARDLPSPVILAPSVLICRPVCSSVHLSCPFIHPPSVRFASGAPPAFDMFRVVWRSVGAGFLIPIARGGG